MRRGEILSLTWGQYFPEKRLLELIDTKNGHGRFVPLSSKAMAAISHGAKQNERVFLGQMTEFAMPSEALGKISYDVFVVGYETPDIGL